MSGFKKLNLQPYRKHTEGDTPDTKYWKKIGVPVLVKEFGPIDYIDFSPIEPHYFAVTCSVRVQIYNPVTKLVVKNLSRFRENAYGASFRSDGKLICSGGEEAAVKLFDVSSKSLLRLFKGHTAAVHRTFFTPHAPQIVSYSDDKTVKLWDIPTEVAVQTYEDHTDYVRAGATNPTIPNIILSGSYDQTVKMYDTRTNNTVLSVNHGSPIESVLYLPTGGIFLSAGGTDIKIWDAIAGGKLLGYVSQHHKTITCLRMASNNKRLMSGSLDKHVKIYDIATYKVVHSLNFPNAVLSLGVSKNDDTVVAGLVDGIVSIRRRKDNIVTPTEKKEVSYHYKTQPEQNDDGDLVVKERDKEKIGYNFHLRKFNYSTALEMVLHKSICKKTPETTVVVIHDLQRRQGFEKAIKILDWDKRIQLICFFTRNLPVPRFTRMLLPAVECLLQYMQYADDVPVNCLVYLKQLQRVVNTELELLDSFAVLQGAMELILAASTPNQVGDKALISNLEPSEIAQANLVVNLT